MRSPYRLLTVVLILGSTNFLACQESAEIAIPRLQKKLYAKESSVRNQAALKLAGYGPEAAPATAALASTLKDSNAGVRSSAAFALRSIGTPEAEDALNKYQK